MLLGHGGKNGESIGALPLIGIIQRLPLGKWQNEFHISLEFVRDSAQPDVPTRILVRGLWLVAQTYSK